MKSTYIPLIILFLIMAHPAYARSGCCSHHGGESGSCYHGKSVCNDGTLSPSCRCYSQNQNVPSIPYGNPSSPPLPKKNMQGCCSHHGGVSSECFQGKQLCNDGTVSQSCLCDISYQEKTINAGPQNSFNDNYTPNFNNSRNNYPESFNYNQSRKVNIWSLKDEGNAKKIENKNKDNDILSIRFSPVEDRLNQAVIFKNSRTYYVSFEVDFLNIGCNCLLNPVSFVELEFSNGAIIKADLLGLSQNNSRIIYNFVPSNTNNFLRMCFDNKWLRIRSYENNYLSMCYSDFFLTDFKQQAKSLYRNL